MPEDPPMFLWFRSEGRMHLDVPDLGDVRGYRTAVSIGHLAFDVLEA